ncbi:Fe2+-dependent dioxygenase [Shinella zoogloeoides]|uniref:Fe2+-dependent dioxygenase n=1 Tax=Shinella zoogloeoides TaxID=352475 RepID=UPI0028AB764E|nr:Fe2+-dependent dioxygenase [Shinella zoogloeoides]
MLIHLRNVLTRDEVAHCRAVLERAEWVSGASNAGEQARKVKFNLQVPPDSAAAKELGEIVLAALGRNPVFNSAVMPLRVLPPLFNRYDVGMKYGNHVDGAIRSVYPGGPRMRQDVSTSLFLSDPEEYDGGELVVEDTYGSHRVKLPAGDAVIYPTTSLHRVEEITRGSRWASFFWTQSMVRDDGQRALLHDLDNAIIGLRQTLTDDHPSVLSLVNIYHNLLRQAADL